MTIEHLDVIIIGAGLSGIGAAVHLQKNCPQHQFAILESRRQLGGTWDLFRYPGIRSDSDMYTLGYSFKPWSDSKSIADGAKIWNYIADTAQQHDLGKRIRYEQRVVAAQWSSDQKQWAVDVETGPAKQRVQMTCQFLLICTGYYNYERGYTPEFKGQERYQGSVVHPQKWDESLDYAGKRVVIIGSGATAVTLVPAMAKTAAHVTMLQRSPTYIVARPAQDALANWLNRHLPSKSAYLLSRWKNVLLGMLFYGYSKRRPEVMKRFIIKGVRQALPAGYDVEKHFTPSYNPWDQRVCLIPDADLFKSIRRGQASVVTDHIDHFTETGIQLTSGATLDADIIVTATGLDLLALGGMQLIIDGKPLVLNQTMTYKGMMLAGVPNMAYVTGYTNASWTLKADLISAYVCRILNTLRDKGYRAAVPKQTDPTMQAVRWVDFTSGYIERSIEKFPMQGNKAPWRLYQNYPKDMASLKFGSLHDKAMHFEK